MIRFDQVTKKYPGTHRPALGGVTLEVLRGEFVFLVGASGSGKSSFLRLVLREERPSSGQIHVLGQDLGRLSSRKVPYFRRNLGVVFQDFRLLPQKSVFDNVAFTLQVIGKSKGFIHEAVPDVLKMVGLAGKANRLPHELSGGEQQRVAIARAIVNKPAILLADEPTGNLDPATSAGIMTLLERISAGGTTVLMATHDAGIVNKMKRRVIELVSGRIVRDEREGGYQTLAVPAVSAPGTAAFSAPSSAPVVEAGAGKGADAALAAPQTSAAPELLEAPPAPAMPVPAPPSTISVTDDAFAALFARPAPPRTPSAAESAASGPDPASGPASAHAGPATTDAADADADAAVDPARPAAPADPVTDEPQETGERP